MSNYNESMEQTPANSLFYLSRIKERADRFLIEELERRGVKGLVPSHGNLLVALFREQRLTMKQLSERVRRDKSTITTLVGKLLRLKLVARHRDQEDGRVIWITLTPAATRLLPVFLEIRELFLGKTFAGISQGDQQKLMKMLRQMYDNLE